jgi:protein-S-isoprenylcysteine O-methyltransferase Ste14
MAAAAGLGARSRETSAQRVRIQTMPLLGLVLSAIAGLLVSLPLPFAAWRLCVRRFRARPITSLAIVAATLVSYFLCVGLYLSTRPPSPPTQHSQFEGLEPFVAWAGLGVCHLLSLALFLALAFTRSAPARAAGSTREGLPSRPRG